MAATRRRWVPLGLLLDQALMHLVARRSAAALVARLAEEFERVP